MRGHTLESEGETFRVPGERSGYCIQQMIVPITFVDVDVDAEALRCWVEQPGCCTFSNKPGRSYQSRDSLCGQIGGPEQT